MTSVLAQTGDVLLLFWAIYATLWCYKRFELGRGGCVRRVTQNSAKYQWTSGADCFNLAHAKTLQYSSHDSTWFVIDLRTWMPIKGIVCQQDADKQHHVSGMFNQDHNNVM